jgi:hypothetical protein
MDSTRVVRFELEALERLGSTQCPSHLALHAPHVSPRNSHAIVVANAAAYHQRLSASVVVLCHDSSESLMYAVTRKLHPRRVASARKHGGPRWLIQPKADRTCQSQGAASCEVTEETRPTANLWCGNRRKDGCSLFIRPGPVMYSPHNILVRNDSYTSVLNEFPLSNDPQFQGLYTYKACFRFI